LPNVGVLLKISGLQVLCPEPMTTRAITFMVYLAAVASGAAISVAWWVPDTLASALLGWLAACLLVYTVRARTAYLPAYCCGLVCCTFGFYWVFRTVADFGGFGAGPSAIVFALFVTGSAVQFLVFAFVHNHLGPRFDRFALRSPTALVVSELVSIRVFFWHYGHTQVAFTPLVQVADLAGAMTVSFLMVWLAEVLVRVLVFREMRMAFWAAPVVLGLALLYGFFMIGRYSSPSGVSQDVVLVQGNIPQVDKFEPERVIENIRKLHTMSEAAPHEGALVVWPETSIPFLLNAGVRSAREEPALPWLRDGAAVLLGAFAEEADKKRYIAAFGVQPDGAVPPPYFKQILIPFGEYTPGSSVLPWLASINANTGGFTPGGNSTVFDYAMKRRDGSTYSLRLSPLICYEDTVPTLARRATRNGAELLVNLTNDAWFGPTAAPWEHHLIASFRAIENRRFLVRATNSGVTSIVDPLGRTRAHLPIFSEGVLRGRVTLLREQSAYTRFVGEWPWWTLLVASLVEIVVERRRVGTTRTPSPPSEPKKER
jgi:apolipoprotein N-acyltransferase